MSIIYGQNQATLARKMFVQFEIHGKYEVFTKHWGIFRNSCIICCSDLSGRLSKKLSKGVDWGMGTEEKIRGNNKKREIGPQQGSTDVGQQWSPFVGAV